MITGLKHEFALTDARGDVVLAPITLSEMAFGRLLIAHVLLVCFVGPKFDGTLNDSLVIGKFFLN